MLRSLSEILRFESKDPCLTDVSLSRLGQILVVRHVPELRFRHDDSISRGEEITRLIDDVTGANRQG